MTSTDVTFGAVWDTAQTEYKDSNSVKSFSNKVAAITGAGSGIGRALARALADEACDLALSDVDEAGLAETVRLLKDSGVRCTTRRLDVADRAVVHEWADEVVREHGKVNLIFNNAGVALGATVEGMSDADFEWLMNINFWGVAYGTRAFLPHLKAAGEGHVINISSVFGLASMPTQGAYNAAKFAVRGLTESLRIELDMQDCGVSATCVHPGGIKTSIARNARTDASMSSVGIDQTDSQSKMEKTFTTTPERAAQVILKAVRGNRRRALIGADAHLIDLMVRCLGAQYQPVVSFLTRKLMS